VQKTTSACLSYIASAGLIPGNETYTSFYFAEGLLMRSRNCFVYMLREI